MRRMVVVAISLLAPLSVASADAASVRHKATAMCRLAHPGQLAANPHAQLYVAPEPHSDSLENPGVYGCVYGHRPVFLGGRSGDLSSEGGEGITHAKLAGSVAAYEAFFIGGYEGRVERRVVVRSLRSGRVLRRVPDGISPTHDPGGV